jgi:hypothetical protein
MSNNTELSVTENSNELIDWIENAITKNYFKYHEYENFSNIQEIGSGSFGKVCRVNWKSSPGYLALKSFFDLNHITAKEIVYEVINYNINIFFVYLCNIRYIQIKNSI